MYGLDSRVHICICVDSWVMGRIFFVVALPSVGGK